MRITSIFSFLMKYSVVILENEAMLQQLKATTETSSAWEINSETDARIAQLSERKEYQLKIGRKESHLAFQIWEASTGIARKGTRSTSPGLSTCCAGESNDSTSQPSPRS